MKQSLLTVDDVVRMLQISRRTAYYWVKQGILKPIRMGGVLRFHPEDIDSLIEKNRPTGFQRKKRILIIDDDILVRESMKPILERSGYEAIVAKSGAEAIDLISREVFDLIITDIRMPEMNGIETLKAIRDERKRFGKLPLPEIILTAYDDHEVRKKASELGVRDFILKPFELDQFLNLMRARLS